MLTTQVDLAGLERNVRRLERQAIVRGRLTVAFLLALVLFAGGGWMLQDPADTLKSRKGFAVVDEEGRVRAFFGLNPEGGVGLSLLDDRGTHRVDIRLAPTGQDYGLFVNDSSGKCYMFSGLRSGEYVHHFYDANNVTRLAIGERISSGTSGITVKDENDVPRLGLGELAARESRHKAVGMFIHDEKKHARVQMYNVSGAGSAIRLLDEKGAHPRISLAVGNDERSWIEVLGIDSKPRFGVGIRADNILEMKTVDKSDTSVDLLNTHAAKGQRAAGAEKGGGQ